MSQSEREGQDYVAVVVFKYYYENYQRIFGRNQLDLMYDF